MSHGCNEYSQISRRSLLKSSLATTLAASLGSAWLPRVTYAQQAGARDVLITVFLRGGADGLTMCAPFGDSNYAGHRPTIAIPAPGGGSGSVNLDGFFCLPQPMSPLFEAYANGHLAVVHAVGSPNWTRSHFDAMKWMETSSRDVNAATGWVGRHLSTTTPMVTDAPLRGITLGYESPRMLAGGDKSLPIPNPDYFGYDGWYSMFDVLTGAIESNYTTVPDMSRNIMRDTKRTMVMLDAINFQGYQASGGAIYPDNDFGYGMKASAALIKAELGIEAIHLDLGGWDTHDDQQPLTGYMAELMDTLAKSIGALYRDLHTDNRMNFTLVVMSEFGRTAIENGSRGVDHGTGGAIWVLGGNVNGGQVYRQWPGLATNQLFEEVDLQATIDYRNVLGEIAVKRLKTANVANLFPNFTPSYLNLVRA